MVKSNIPIYIYYFFKNPLVFYNTIINPEHFPKGSDTVKIIINKPSTVTKFFKNSTGNSEIMECSYYCKLLITGNMSNLIE